MTDLEPAPDWGDEFDRPWYAEITHSWGPFYSIRYTNGRMEDIGITPMMILGKRHAERKARRGAARRNRKSETWIVVDSASE